MGAYRIGISENRFNCSFKIVLALWTHHANDKVWQLAIIILHVFFTPEMHQK